MNRAIRPKLSFHHPTGFGATLRAAVLFGPGCVARSLQIRVGYARVPVRKHLAPCRGRKLLAANVTEFTLMTTKAVCKNSVLLRRAKRCEPGRFAVRRRVIHNLALRARTGSPHSVVHNS